MFSRSKASIASAMTCPPSLPQPSSRVTQIFQELDGLKFHGKSHKIMENHPVYIYIVLYVYYLSNIAQCFFYHWSVLGITCFCVSTTDLLLSCHVFLVPKFIAKANVAKTLCNPYGSILNRFAVPSLKNGHQRSSWLRWE